MNYMVPIVCHKPNTMPETIIKINFSEWVDACARFCLEVPLGFMAGYPLVPVIIVMVNFILALYFGPLVLISGIFTIVATIVLAFWATVALVWTMVVYPILVLLVVLTLPGTALLIAAIFTCPEKDTFLKWLEPLITRDSDKDKDELKDSNKYWLFTRFFDRYVSQSQIMESIITKSVLKKMKVEYYSWGVCQFAFCTINDADSDKLQGLSFIGIFNTWFPLY